MQTLAVIMVGTIVMLAVAFVSHLLEDKADQKRLDEPHDRRRAKA